MRGNSAIIKCLIPSFVADFVHVVAWINEDQEEILPEKVFVGGKKTQSNDEFSFLPTPQSEDFINLFLSYLAAFFCL